MGLVDFIVSPYNCEETDGVRRYPDVVIDGKAYPQPTCNCVAGNSANSRDASLPSVWANRAGSVYVGGDDPHYITNRGTAGATDKHGTVVAQTTEGVEEILFLELPLS